MRDKIVVPDFVGEWLSTQSSKEPLFLLESLKYNGNKPSHKKVKDWAQNYYGLSCNGNAWQRVIVEIAVNGFVLEEKLYYVPLPCLYKNNTHPAYLSKGYEVERLALADNYDFAPQHFTEKELKSYDGGYWAFALPLDTQKEEDK